MNDFNDNFEATIGSQNNAFIKPVEQNNDNVQKNFVKDIADMKIDDGMKNLTEKEKEEMLLAKKRNREEEEKK
jgi:hypothetical protein